MSKYDEVLQHLELSREYVKQFVLIGDTADKGKKRQAKRDVLERTAADTAKIKQVLIIQVNCLLRILSMVKNKLKSLFCFCTKRHS